MGTLLQGVKQRGEEASGLWRKARDCRGDEDDEDDST